MELAQRVKELLPSPTLAISAKAKALRAAGERVFSLAAGEPDFPTPDHIQQAAVDAMRAGHTGYAPTAGVPPLRDAIRALYQRELGLDFGDDQVVVGCGAKQCLYNAFQALLDPGSEALIQAPYWVSYPEQVKLCGARPVIVEPPPGGAGLNLEAMADAISERTRLVILNSPCNPTGCVAGDADLDALAALAVRHDLLVVSDDIYDKLLYDGRRFVSIVQRAPAMQERTLLVNGVSKTYAMTGWRLGWAVGPPPVIASMRKVQDQSTSNATTFVQHAAVAALASPPGIVEEMVQKFAQRRQRLVSLLNAIPGVRCQTPAGTFYAWASFAEVLGRRCDGQPLDSTVGLAELLLDRERVAVVPGEAFGAAGFIRFSFATSLEDIEEAAGRVHRLVESLD